MKQEKCREAKSKHNVKFYQANNEYLLTAANLERRKDLLVLGCRVRLLPRRRRGSDTVQGNTAAGASVTHPWCPW